MTQSLQKTVAGLDWAGLEADIRADGFAVTPPLLAPDACAELAAGFADRDRFRSHIDMARYRFGQGAYRYYAYPLPPAVAALRAAFYAALAPIANRLRLDLGQPADFPDAHDAYLARCHGAGQTRPTPLLLRYGPGDYNCLHQDLYGDLVFPLQAACLLNAPGTDFTGGEFVLVEQRPRAQSRPMVVPLQQGAFVVFCVRERPVQGARGFYRVQLRHGVSRLRGGQRHTLGLIFHDAA